jgi:hypothetical protein
VVKNSLLFGVFASGPQDRARKAKKKVKAATAIAAIDNRVRKA